MKKLFLLIVLILLTTKPALASSEQIDHFDAIYQINQDGTVDVTENTTYNAAGAPHHGILRQVELTRTNDQGQKFRIDVSNISVNAPYSDQSTSDELSLKIGDPNTTFTGIKTFQIKYTLRGAVTYFADHDELYWNITGNNWPFPVANTEVRVNLPPTGSAVLGGKSQLQVTCYTGQLRSKNQNCQVSSMLSGAFIQTSFLNTGEGLTIVTGFPKNLVAQVDATPITGPSLLQTILTALLAVTFYLFLPFGVIIWWFIFGRDPRVPHGPTAWFDPPKHQNGRSMLPAEVGTLTDESVDPQDISATIVSLAIRGFLKIAKNGNDFTLTKSPPKKDNDALVDFEQTIYDGLFKSRDSVNTKTLKTTFYSSVETAKKTLYSNLTSEKYFDHNPNTVRQIYTGLGAASFFVFNFLLGATLLIFSRFMPKKTLLGAQKKEEALSLKRFLTSQERQLTFQEQNWYFFEKLLPYAVAFGVTKVWAQRFKDLAVPTEVNWYQGDSGLFNAMLFANSLDSFSHTASAMTSSPYSSTRSSSGFSSGFSGGFSGGGGGGGGGGSW